MLEHVDNYAVESWLRLGASDNNGEYDWYGHIFTVSSVV